ncbi:MAG: hypothetical protein M1826_004126 [Phylliscum demangeonii]|nr:MAG: hypothetical protein M1826_004126 [Phylliscum demangeonii]
MVLGHFGFGVARSFAGFVGIFRHLHSNSLTEGASVVVYTASVRGAARISGAAVTQDATEDNLLDAGTMSSTRRPLETARSEQATEITCHFLGSREYVTLAGQVLIMSSAIESLSTSPEGRLDGASFLEGFVGRIVRLIV